MSFVRKPLSRMGPQIRPEKLVQNGMVADEEYDDQTGETGHRFVASMTRRLHTRPGRQLHPELEGDSKTSSFVKQHLFDGNSNSRLTPLPIMLIALPSAGLFKADEGQHVSCALLERSMSVLRATRQAFRTTPVWDIVKGGSQPKDIRCEPCQASKQTQNTFDLSTNHALEPLKILNMDLSGPFEPDTLRRSRYLMIIVDNHSRYFYVADLRNKDQTRYAGTTKAVAAGQLINSSGLNVWDSIPSPTLSINSALCSGGKARPASINLCHGRERSTGCAIMTSAEASITKFPKGKLRC